MQFNLEKFNREHEELNQLEFGSFLPQKLFYEAWETSNELGIEVPTNQCLPPEASLNHDFYFSDQMEEENKDLLAETERKDSEIPQFNVQEKNISTICSMEKPSKARWFQPLLELLGQYFENQTLELNKDISPVHLRVVLTLIRRKLGVKREKLPESTALLLEELKKVTNNLSLVSAKRREENQKFVFKHVLKLMRLNLRNPSSLGVSCKKEVSINKRYEFTKEEAKALANTRSSAICVSNLKQLLQNQNFRNDFIEMTSKPTILQSPLVRSYSRSIHLKLTKLFRKWNVDSAQQTLSSVEESKIIDYLQNNNQCKLPWSLQEIDNAIKSMLDAFGMNR